jgi:hypothetical protein
MDSRHADVKERHLGLRPFRLILEEDGPGERIEPKKSRRPRHTRSCGILGIRYWIVAVDPPVSPDLPERTIRRTRVGSVPMSCVTPADSLCQS